MSVKAYGRYQGDVIFEDAHGDAALPVRLVHVLSYDCLVRGADSVSWNGRAYDSTDLVDVRAHLDANNLPELDPCDGCRDAPGVHDMGDGCTYCTPCCSAAQGSHYDDPLESA